MDNVPSYVSSYFTKWSANIIEHVSLLGIKFVLVIKLSSTWLVTMVTEVEKGIEPTLAWRYQARSPPAASTSFVIFSQVPRCSLTPKRECQVR